MFINDLPIIFRWYVMMLGLGLISWPVVRYFFGRFTDWGWALTKVFGAGTITLTMWLFGFAKVLPLTQPGVGMVVVIWGMFNGLIFFKYQGGVSGWKKVSWKLVAAEELMFGLMLFGWAFVRAHQPNIEGLEKYMDFGFVNAVLRSQYPPVKDIWLSGYTINYYYFGHYLTAVLTKLSGLASFYTYNLMLATIVGLAFVGAFSFGYHTVKLGLEKLVSNKDRLAKWAIIAGLLAGILLNFGGNLHTVTHKLREGNKPYWYPDATRFIDYREGSRDKTIHEFPIYSHVVADLHGHLNNLPFVILFLNLLVVMTAGTGLWLRRKNLAHLGLMGVLLGVMSMTNFWDLPIYLLVFGGSLFLYSLAKWKLSLQAMIETIKPMLVVWPIIFLVLLPFQMHFNNFSKGVALVNARSPLWMLLVLWGFFLVLLIGFVGLVVYSWRWPPVIKKQKKKDAWAKMRAGLVLRMARLLQVEIAVQKRRKLRVRLDKIQAGNQIQPMDLLILAILLTGLFLIIFPEVAYVKDIYIASHHRANTMFKLTYQTFVMTMLVAGYVFYRIRYTPAVWTERAWFNRLWRLVFVVCVASVMIYPYFAIKSYYGNLRTGYKGLDGLSYLKVSQPGDWSAINWLNTNVSGQPVVLEAVGDSYTMYARISANTGLPTVLGWPVHEWLWRGSYDIPGQRTGEVKRLYESTDLTESKSLLNQYQVEYIIVGKLEAEKYTDLNRSQFRQLGKVVFADKGTTIYRVNPNGIKVDR